jgi:glycosyltransferase involved in cell wall biosynthesis
MIEMLITVLLAAAAILSSGFLIRTLFIIKFTPVLSTSEFQIAPPPLVSILLPARNEQFRILRDNAKSLISQSYKNTEVIAVDDRSTDMTLKILHEVASIDLDRFTIINGNEPQPGWMGKIFALDQAKKASSGEWLVSVDADVIYSNEIIASSLSFAQEHGLDALSLLSHVEVKSFWEAVVVPAMSWLSLMRVSPTQANRKSSKPCFGYGNFILFKRKVHDFIGGFEAYKDNILDDCVIMEMCKSKGFNVMVADGSNHMHSRMYTNLREIVLGFAKNSFAALRFSVPRTISVILLEVLMVGFPLLYIAIRLFNNGPHVTPQLVFPSVSMKVRHLPLEQLV